MISTRSWPEPAVRVLNLAQRLQKFIVVGAVGLATQQVLVFVFHELLKWHTRPSLVAAIAVSMVVTFTLNEYWTWHDRGKGHVLGRMAYYVPVNTIGLLINLEVAVMINSHGNVHLQIASLIGAGVAAIWNFGANNLLTWRA